MKRLARRSALRQVARLIGMAFCAPAAALGNARVDYRTSAPARRELLAKDHGLKGDGITDDGPANRAFLKLCQSSGADAVYTSGIYLFATMTGENHVLIPAPSDTRIIRRGRVVFKAGGGMNSAAPFGWNFIAPERTGPDFEIRNLVVRGITFDHNGANNTYRMPATPKNAAVLAPHCRNVVIQDCKSLNNAGRQSFSLGSVDDDGTPTAEGVIVERCSIRNVAQAIPGNASATDHSSIYVVANGFTIRDIDCSNDRPCSVSTGVEFHGTRGRVYRVNVRHYAQAANFSAQVCDTEDVVLGPGVIGSSLLAGITFWCNAGRTLDAQVTGPNDFRFRTNVVSPFDAYRNIDECAIFSLRFEGTRYRYEGSRHAINAPDGLRIRYFRSLVFRGNHAQDLLGRALYIGTCSPGDGAHVRIENNVFERCSSTTMNAAYDSAIMLGVDAPCTFKTLTLTANRAYACGSTLYALSSAPVKIGAMQDENTSIDRTMKRGGMIGAAVRLAPGRIRIQRTDNASPQDAVRASYGSEIVDSTTGTVWRCNESGESAQAWIPLSS
ncbi:hypothetical protein AWB77_00072 [Caballeronia fortuita]|uniref:Pectate lyase superfamily protein n=1 Tax=Caballeronia fortuita TaxID=1777138 RepID=A0A157Z1K8_9BURK|nr:hypothetical protein [Caballeronia fortuita]SAK39354.1 hypothetical protein AWB77_00072 [Caballeronia fortuita]